MKRIILSVIVTLFVTAIAAQTVNVHFKNGQTVQFNSANVDYVDFSLKAPDPTLTAGQVVDLGLSVYWASCNVGAEAPEEYGEYYAWGETSPKSSYSKENYAYYNSSTTKYIEIGENICGTEYDAATINLGSDWRMPTREEMKELIEKCAWEWTQIKGINGYRVQGKNGNTIFLPATGFKLGGYLRSDDRNMYYTGSEDTNEEAFLLSFDNTHQYLSSWGAAYKHYGLAIRPVTSNPNAGGTPIDHSNDHLVTDKISASFAGGAYSSFNDLINSGSQLNWRFTNGSSESVTLTGIQLINGVTNAEGNNMLSENVEVAAGETKAYTITVGAAGIRKPKIRFTYRYNQKSYSVEASMPD